MSGLARLPARGDESPVTERLAVAGVRAAARARDLATRSGLIELASRRRVSDHDHVRAQAAHSAIGAILADLPAEVADGVAPRWSAGEIRPGSSDVTLVDVGPPGRSTAALLKLADTAEAGDALERQRRALVALQDDRRLSTWGSPIPRILAAGEVSGRRYTIETTVAGESLEAILARPGAHADAQRGAAAAIGALHRATASEIVVEDSQLDRWVLAPAQAVAGAVRPSRRRAPSLLSLVRLSDELCGALAGQRVAVSWIHGDYSPGNIVVDSGGRAIGIVDWEYAHPDDLGSVDVATLLVCSRMIVRRQELGPVVRELLAAPALTDDEARSLHTSPDAPLWQAAGLRALVLMCWLRHAAHQAVKRERLADRQRTLSLQGLWIHTNIHDVLQGYRRLPTSTAAGRIRR